MIHTKIYSSELPYNTTPDYVYIEMSKLERTYLLVNEKCFKIVLENTLAGAPLHTWIANVTKLSYRFFDHIGVITGVHDGAHAPFVKL